MSSTIGDKPPEIVYIVQRLGWEYQDCFYEVDDDEPVRAFTDRRAAERYCAQRDAEEKAAWPPEKLARRRGDTDAFYEVVAVELA